MPQQINLYNPALAPKVDVFGGAVLLLALACVLGLSLFAWALVAIDARRIAAKEAEQSARLAALQADIGRMAKELAARKPDPALQRELSDLEALVGARNQVMATLASGALGDTQGVSEYFRAFARQRAEGVWLTGFSVGAAGRQIVIQGRTTDAQALPEYLGRLRRESALRGRAFESLTVSQPAAPAAADGRTGGQAQFLEFRMATSSPRADDVRAGSGR
jgi:Tfp pilus assembly protein PilN